MLRIDRHELGPRVYVLGRRIHEYMLGAGVLATLLAGSLFERWEFTHRVDGIAVFGGYLVAKDWRDLVPSQRNTARWSLLPHRPPRR